MPQARRQGVLVIDHLDDEVMQALAELDGGPHLRPRLDEPAGHQPATGFFSLYDHFTEGFGRYVLSALLPDRPDLPRSY